MFRIQLIHFFWSLRLSFLLSFLILFSTYSLKAFGFSDLPEFRGISNREASQIQLPKKINAEYSSDYLTFLKPLHWDKLFWQNPNAFDLSTGSLSGEEFFVKDRLKLHQWLVEAKLQFRFNYFAERDYEVDQEHNVLELVYRPIPLLGISLYGETSFFKAEDDVGLALLLNPNSQSEHRLFYTLVDYSRNKRNTQNDEFKKEPVRYGLVGRHIKGDWYFDYAFTNAPDLIWDFPDAQRRYESQNWLAEVQVLHELSNGSRWGIEVLRDDFFEAENALLGGPLTSKSLRRKRWLTRIESLWALEGFKISSGVAYFYRDYKIDEDRLLFRDYSPSVGLVLEDKSYEYFDWLNEISVSTTHYNGNEEASRTASSSQIQNEARLNWRTAFEFKKQGELVLLLTFDLDEFGSGRTWEGGNAQFRFWF